MHRIVISILLVAVWIACLADARTLHVNTTLVEQECYAQDNMYVYCNFTDPKYWIENISPENGDSILMGTPFTNGVHFYVQEPLSLEAFDFEGNGFTFSSVTFRDQSGSLTINNMVGAGYINLSNGQVTVLADRNSAGSFRKMFRFYNGTVTLKTFFADTVEFELVDNITVERIEVSAAFRVLHSTVRCDLLTTKGLELYGGVVDCSRVETRGREVYVAGLLQADVLVISNPTLQVSIRPSGTLNVASISTTQSSRIEVMTVEGKVIGSGQLLDLRNIDKLEIANGSISAPKIEIRSGNLITNGGSINGNTTIYSTKISVWSLLLNQNPSLAINGDLNIVNTNYYVAVQRGNDNEDPWYGQIWVNGHFSGKISVFLSVFADVLLPANRTLTLMRYNESNVDMIDLADGAAADLKLTATSTTLFVQIPEPKQPTNNTPIASNTVDPLLIAVVALAILCAGLIVALIIVIANRKRDDGYQALEG